MSIEINNVIYFSAAEITKELGISRQTFWRWRHEGKIPTGHRFRDGRILYTREQVFQIKKFANRLEPIEQGAGQLQLFG